MKQTMRIGSLHLPWLSEAKTFGMLGVFLGGCVLGACASGSSDEEGSPGDGAAGTESQAGSRDAQIDAGSPLWELPEEADADELPRFVQYIRAAPYERLVLEVDSVPGYEPDPEVESRLVDRLERILDKPGGVVIEHDESLSPRGSDHAWTQQELNELAERSFRNEVPDDSIAMHVMMLDGHSDRDGDGSVVLGLAWGHLYIVIFRETIENGCSGELLGLTGDRACREAELAILTHEVGHVLGLVDNGLPMVEPHRDPDHGRHDEDPDCIMYWAYTGEGLFDRVAELLQSSEDALGFCAHCLQDIAAVQ